MQSFERLADEIAALATDIQAATCRWLILLAEFDERQGWAIEGCKTCAQWVGWRCGVGREAAREYVRVARRLGELSRVREAFGTGRLSYSKVRALTRVEDVALEEELVQLAMTTTAAQLEQVVRAYKGVVVAQRDVQQHFESRFVEWSRDDDGSVRIRGRLTPEQGEMLIKAIEGTRDDMLESVSAETPWGEAGEVHELPPVGARNADALAQLADTALAAAAASTGGDRYQLVVHLDAGRAELEPGTPLATETMRRVACDASVVQIVERDGKALSVGRKTRCIPPAIRRALRSRDRCCQFPGCANSRHVDAHHLHHWADGGHTDLANLVQLCRHHHRLVHEGGFSISGEPGDLVFTSPSGRRLRPGPSVRRLPRGSVARVPAETVVPPYERLDLALAVDAMLDIAPLPERGSPGPPGLVAA